MTSEQVFVIVGGGLAGARAAEALRTEAFTGRVVLVAGEQSVPYERPPLSKGYLQGHEDRESFDVHPAEWYTAHNVDLLLGVTASAISLRHRQITLADGSVLTYDRLLLATGASARRFDGPGADLVGVHHLRSADDSTLLRVALKAGGRRVLVIGSGWIGLEVAAAAATYGNTVTVLGRGAVPLGSVLGDDAAEVFADLHRANGVELWMHSEVSEILGDAHGVTGVVLAGGEQIAADLVVVGMGATPNVQLARAAGLDVHDGIRVDASFQTTDAAVYAVGDVAEVFHPVLGEHQRVDHWANANTAPTFAARAMLGQAVSYDAIPYFFTDQFDLGMEYSGYPSLTNGAELIVRGDRPGREYVAFWLQDSRVVAGMNVNVWDVNDDVQQLIRSGGRVDAARLADPQVPLSEIVAEMSTSGPSTDVAAERAASVRGDTD